MKSLRLQQLSKIWNSEEANSVEELGRKKELENSENMDFCWMFNIDKHEYADLTEFVNTIHGLSLDTVPKIETNFKLPDTIEDLLLYSDDKSYHNPNFDREGVVIRSLDRKISFKVISNKFLLNGK